MSGEMWCPRRQELPGPPSTVGGPDTYEPGHGLVGQALGCSYCGSLPPEEFMAAVREGAELGPTDKTYKVYLHRGGRHRHDARSEAKFYFQHLSEEQRQEFFELLRDGRLTIGYPGHFYVLPFFIRGAPR